MRAKGEDDGGKNQRRGGGEGEFAVGDTTRWRALEEGARTQTTPHV